MRAKKHLFYHKLHLCFGDFYVNDFIFCFSIRIWTVDYSFPNQQFSIDGYKTYRRDRSNFGGGLLFYVNENIPCRELTTQQIDTNFEIIFLEITPRTRKWLVIGLYKPPNQKEEYFFKNLGIVLNNYLSEYEHIILLGDFNLTTSNKYLADFMTLFNLESLILPLASSLRNLLVSI